MTGLLIYSQALRKLPKRGLSVVAAAVGYHHGYDPENLPNYYLNATAP